jgi:hypothetical protein
MITSLQPLLRLTVAVFVLIMNRILYSFILFNRIVIEVGYFLTNFVVVYKNTLHVHRYCFLDGFYAPNSIITFIIATSFL